MDEFMTILNMKENADISNLEPFHT